MQSRQDGVNDELETEVAFGFVLFEPCPLLGDLDQVPTMRLDYVVDIDSGSI
jgi:hypothetical protein